MGDIRARLSSLSLSLPLFAVVVFAAGCGDNTPPTTGTGGSGGGTGGVAGSTGTGGGGGMGEGGNGGGSEIDGGTGGATGGVGGASATGGVGGGTTGTGGVGGGTIGTGGVGGGTAGTGGATGGTTGHDAGIDVPPTPCYTTAFTAPTAGATLTVADDSDHTCANGFQYTVTITSNAPDGTNVTLYDGSSLLKTVQVTGGTASFPVQLSTSGTAQNLSIQYPSTLACNVSEQVTVSCPNSPPTCSISAPVISATHPDLNGVAAPQGDRTSSTGSPYQATFVVNTSAEDGQTVTLAVDNAAAPGTPVDGTPSAVVAGGAATFGLTLAPDGTYEVIATCTNKEGITGTSTKSSFTVDTTPPDLTLNSPTAGQFVVGGTINVCAQTDSKDAAGLSSSLGTAQNNLCVTLGTSATPTCTAVQAINTSTCLSFACPSSAPFSLTVNLADAAGNPTSQTITGVSCASSLPSVEIIAPASDAPAFTNQADHILAANAPVGVPDENASTPGAQADVVACTDTAGTATLFVGHQGDVNLGQLGSAIATAAAAPTDNCPSGFGFVARFAGVTLPESSENADGTLSAATEMKVSVTSAANSADIGTSGADDVWVDSIAPSLTFLSPGGLCGSFTQSSTTVTEDVAYTADDKLVVADVTNNGVTTTYDTPAYVSGVATFGGVAFAEGQNALVATESDPAGNATVLATCTITIGTAPVVTFTTPTAGALLCPFGATAPGCIDDSDPSTPGWQGSLGVLVTAGSGQAVVGSVITFTEGSTTFGSATTDVIGSAQINGVTLPEGVQTITATTDNVPGAGVGSGTVNVTVDTTAPNAPTGLNVSIVDRRKTSMQLTWTAPSDAGGGNVTGYQVRYAKTPITSAAAFSAATAFAYTGSPASPGQLDGITISPLYIENNYYFAVEATDITGTASAMLATPSGGSCTCAGNCCAAHFNVTTIPSVAGGTENFGFSIDGQGDLNGDGLSDLLVGTSGGGKAYLYFGNAAGTNSTFSATTPSVTFSGSAANFGSTVAQIGDVDNDGFPDIAISDPFNNFKVYIYKGRLTWPPTLTDAQADYTISGDATYNNSGIGLALARLGDFTGDGVDDFAIGADRFATNIGRVIIIPGQKTGFASVTLPDITHAITIDGDSTLGLPFFGESLVGLGHFYTVSTGTTLVVGSPGKAASATSNPGHVYVFHGQAGTGGAIAIGAADQVIVGPATSTFIGTVVSNLGPIVGQYPNVGVGNPSDLVDFGGFQGTGFVMSGTPTTGPLSGKLVVSEAGIPQSGPVILGGGLSGRDVSLSLIGDTTPDLLFTGEIGGVVTISDGKKVPASGTVDTVSTADTRLQFPTGWTIGPNGGSLLPDVNGDGYLDFAIRNATLPGAVAVCY